MDEARAGRPDEAEAVTARVRGLLLGLGAGEVVGTHPVLPARGPLAHGVATQLACFTADAAVRASVRATASGSGSTGDVRGELLGAYRRWSRAWSTGHRVAVAPQGWVDQVTLLTASAGDARDTVRGLATGSGGTRETPVSSADGWHAVARALPLAVSGLRSGPDAATAAVDSAATTHGARTWGPTALAVLVATAALRSGDAARSVGAGISAAVLHGVDFATVTRVDDAVRTAREVPGSPDALRAGAPDDGCASTLWGAVYCLLSHPGPDDAHVALLLAATAPDPVAVCAVTGALLGAVHGEPALPPDVVTRLDVAYVLDVLARDLLRESTRNPDGTWGGGAAAAWRARYGSAE